MQRVDQAAIEAAIESRVLAFALAIYKGKAARLDYDGKCVRLIVAGASRSLGEVAAVVSLPVAQDACQVLEAFDPKYYGGLSDQLTPPRKAAA